MMYGLYRSLIEIGCDNQEAAGIMYREATHYSNVSERRTEVQKHTGFLTLTALQITNDTKVPDGRSQTRSCGRAIGQMAVAVVLR